MVWIKLAEIEDIPAVPLSFPFNILPGPCPVSRDTTFLMDTQYMAVTFCIINIRFLSFRASCLDVRGM